MCTSLEYLALLNHFEGLFYNISDKYYGRQSDHTLTDITKWQKWTMDVSSGVALVFVGNAWGGRGVWGGHQRGAKLARGGRG